MTSVEFTKACIPYNKQYRDLFGYIPCMEHYACTRESFLQALTEAVEKKVELETILPPAAPKDINYMY